MIDFYARNFMENREVLFVCPTFMKKYLAPYVSHMHICDDLKPQNSAKKTTLAKKIVKDAKLFKVRLICFLYNSLLIPEMLKHKPNNIGLIAWHQKHYFPSKFVAKLDRIIEYSVIASSKLETFDHSHSGKYVYMPYPCYISKSDFDIPMKQALRDLIDKHKPYVFSGGENHRDYKTLINAMRITPNVKCIVVTRTHFKDIKKNDPPPNVTVLRGLGRLEFLRLLVNSRAVILPFKGNNSVMGHNLLSEAMYFGKPVIATKNSSFEDSISDGKNGYLVGAQNPSKMAKLVSKIAKDDEVMRKMSKCSLDRGKYRRVNFFMKGINKLCRQVIDERRR